jgi:multiple sugar transport system ATP-binding protein
MPFVEFLGGSMAAVSTRDIIKKFGEVPAINGITLTVPDGEFMVLLGPSGCGKTTFLRVICGLERQTSGDLLIGGSIVNDIPPRARGGDDVPELRPLSALHGAQ